MASPQIENGYTRIANELLEALARAPLNGAQFRIMHALTRETYGRGRKTAIIGYAAIASMTGLHRVTVVQEMSELQGKSYITKAAGHTNEWGVQKDYERWGSSQSTTDEPAKSSLPATPKSSLSTTSSPPATSSLQATEMSSLSATETSSQLTTTPKKERKKENITAGDVPSVAVCDILEEAGLTPRQIQRYHTEIHFTIEQAEACREFVRRKQRHTDRAVSILISDFLKVGKVPKLGANGAPGVLSSVPPPAEDYASIQANSETDRILAELLQEPAPEPNLRRLASLETFVGGR